MRDSSFGMSTGLHTGRPWNGGLIAGRITNFSVLQIVKTGSQANPLSYENTSGGIFFQGQFGPRLRYRDYLHLAPTRHIVGLDMLG